VTLWDFAEVLRAVVSAHFVCVRRTHTKYSPPAFLEPEGLQEGLPPPAQASRARRGGEQGTRGALGSSAPRAGGGRRAPRGSRAS